MRVTFDEEVNAAYIYLRAIEPGGVKYTIPLHDRSISLDFDREDRLVGIEVLDADRQLPPELLPSS